MYKPQTPHFLKIVKKKYNTYVSDNLYVPDNLFIDFQILNYVAFIEYNCEKGQLPSPQQRKGRARGVVLLNELEIHGLEPKKGLGELKNKEKLQRSQI